MKATPLITPPAGFQYFEENRKLPARVDGYHKDFVFIKLPTKANPGEWLRCTWIFKDAKGPAHRGTCKASFVVEGGIYVDAKFEFADQADVPFAEVRQATVALIDRWRSPPPGAEPTPSRLPPSESTAGIPRWVKPPSTFQEKAQIVEFPFGKDGKKLYVPRHVKRISPVYNAAMRLSSLSASFDLDTLDPHKWPNAGKESKNMLSLHLKARLGESGAPFRDLAYYTLKYMHPSKDVPWVMPPEGFTYYEDGYYKPPGVNERVLSFYKPAVGNESEVALRCKVTLKMADGTPNTNPAECWAEFVVPDGIHVTTFFPVEGGNSQAAFTKAHAGAHTLIDRWRVVP